MYSVCMRAASALKWSMMYPSECGLGATSFWPVFAARNRYTVQRPGGTSQLSLPCASSRPVRSRICAGSLTKRRRGSFHGPASRGARSPAVVDVLRFPFALLAGFRCEAHQPAGHLPPLWSLDRHDVRAVGSEGLKLGERQATGGIVTGEDAQLEKPCAERRNAERLGAGAGLERAAEDLMEIGRLLAGSGSMQHELLDRRFCRGIVEGHAVDRMHARPQVEEKIEAGQSFLLRHRQYRNLGAECGRAVRAFGARSQAGFGNGRTSENRTGPSTLTCAQYNPLLACSGPTHDPPEFQLLALVIPTSSPRRAASRTA